MVQVRQLRRGRGLERLLRREAFEHGVGGSGARLQRPGAGAAAVALARV
jgi:hypothetical protein